MHNVLFAVDTHVYVHNQTGMLGIFDRIYLSTGDMIVHIYIGKEHGVYLNRTQFEQVLEEEIVIDMGLL